MNIRVKQRQKDFISQKKSWDEAVFMELLHPSGVFVSKNQQFNAFNTDIITDYTFHIMDLSKLEVCLSKYADKLFNDQFTQALEVELSED